MIDNNWSQPVAVVFLATVLSASLCAECVSGKGDGATTWAIEQCGRTVLAWEATVDAARDVDLPDSFFGTSLHLSVALAGQRSSRTVEALDDLAHLVAGVPLFGDGRTTVDAEMRAVLTARAALPAGASIETLEQRLADLVKRLKDLETTLVGAIKAAPNVPGADGLLTAFLLTQASGDLADGLRYLAGRVRLYGRGTLRGECAAILWRAADAACSGEMVRALGMLAELRETLMETSPTAFQRSSLNTAVSKIDSLLGDGPLTKGSAACGASGVASLLGVSTEWGVGLTRESGTVPAARSTETTWAASGAVDVAGAQIEASVEARRVGHDDVAARDGDVDSASAEVSAAFATDEVDALIGVLVERQRYALQFDREIPASGVAAAMRGVSDLLAEVARLGLPAAVRGRLAAPLDKAHLALQEGRTADAVTALDQFLTQVWKETFGGTLGESAAASLAATVDALLPRREETTWTASASTSGALAGWNGTVDVEWARRAAFADSLAERTDGVASLSAKREAENVTLSVDAEARCVDYPGDASKGYRESQLAVEVSSDEEDLLEVDVGAEWTSTSYALDSRKDKRDTDLALDVAFAGVLGTWALSVSGTKVEYPNDAGRDGWTATWEVVAGAGFAWGDLEFLWRSKEQTTAFDWKMEESLRAELKAEVEAMGFSLAAKVVRATCREDGAACRWTVSWEAGVAVGF